MKNDNKSFDAIKYMREERDKLSKKLSDMTNDEILEYFKSKNSKIKPCA